MLQTGRPSTSMHCHDTCANVVLTALIHEHKTSNGLSPTTTEGNLGHPVPAQALSKYER